MLFIIWSIEAMVPLMFLMLNIKRALGNISQSIGMMGEEMLAIWKEISNTCFTQSML
jgi:hypothetical protein